MFSKNKIRIMLMLLAVMCLAFSCKKETTIETKNSQSSSINGTQSANSTENDQSIYGYEKGTGPNTPPVQNWPLVLDSLSQLSKFEDYDFYNFTRSVTEGNEVVYIIPNDTYFIGYDYLYVITDSEGGVTVWSLYVDDGDKGFDYFYQNNLDCNFSFYDFDSGDEILSGYGNFRNNTMTVTSFDYSYFFYGEREQVPPGQNPGDPKKPWLCGMSMGVVGGIWSAAAGAVTLGAGFIVGMGFTALSIWVCSH